MADVLSQDEIDKLLMDLSSGNLDVEDYQEDHTLKIKDYDFARPAKFSKEHLRTLEIIFEHFNRLVSTNLPAYLRKTVQLDVMSSEAQTYQEFSNALPNPVLLGIVNFNPLSGSIIVELGTNIGFAMIDRMLGGQGEALDKTRDFSEIEISIIERIYNIIVSQLIEPWANVVKLSPRLERIETNPQFAQIISPSEMIAIVTISVKMGDVESLMNVCLPFITLEDVMDKLNTKYWFSTMQSTDETSYDDVIEAAISKAPIPIKAVLGRSSISVMDFINIQKGDIIKIDKGVESPLDVYVGNIIKFKALPGTSGEKYAVKVSEVIRGEE
ncbi:MAG: flagellar motor switch protein FliM [Lachnospiraceae bacterium]|nr:flagellar motor switch protein FliM [Lachnospiraceae bacterium]